MEAVHTLPIYNDEDAARAHLEGLLWPHGAVCPICGVVGEATLLKGKSHRKGVNRRPIVTPDRRPTLTPPGAAVCSRPAA